MKNIYTIKFLSRVQAEKELSKMSSGRKDQQKNPNNINELSLESRLSSSSPVNHTKMLIN